MSAARPDSIASRVESLVHERSLELGHGVLAREVWTSFQAKHGSVQLNVVTNALSALVARGRLLKCGGRIGATAYCHPLHTVPAPADPVAEAAIETVRSVASASGFAVPTELVHDELVSRGVPAQSVNHVRTVLTSLSHSSAFKTERAHPDWAAPRITKVDHVTSGGRKRAYWSFPGGPQAPPPVSDAGDSARQAIAAVVSSLGRPATKREIALWGTAVLGGGAEGDIRVAEATLAKGFAVRLSRVSANDVDRSDDLKARLVRTPLTSRGAYPVRHAVANVSGEALDACIVDDTARLLSPATEIEGIEQLREFADWSGDELLADLADTRAAVLRRAALLCLEGGDASIERLTAAVRLGDRARSVLADWASYIPGFPFEREDARQAIARDGEAANALLVAAGLRSAETGSILTVATYPGSPVGAFQDIALETNVLTGRNPKHSAHLLAPVRRVRGARAGGVSSSVPEDMRAAIDRPDALALLVRAAGLPRASALISEAERVMGTVVRDADLFAALLRQATFAETRTALVIAMALLRRVPPLETVFSNPRSYDDAWVYLTALALGEDQTEERVRLAELADLRARGPASEATEAVLAQFEAGARLGALE